MSPRSAVRATSRAVIRGTGHAVWAGALALFLAAAGVLALRSAAADAGTGLQSADRAWHFRVFVDDREVGRHHFYLDEQGERREVTSVADFEYRLLFLTLYRYEHRSREVWEGDCLSRIESETDANGKPFEVSGRQGTDGFVVDGSKGEQVLPGCVMTFAYWNPAFLTASRLLNTQNGEYLEVRFEGPEPGRYEAGGSPVPSLQYRLEAGKLDIRLWYSDSYEWLGLETRYEGGRTLRYERIAGEPTAPDRIAAR